MVETTISCYKPSGSFRMSTFAYFGLATVAGILLSFIYQWLVRVIPYIYLSILICIAFGLALGGGGYLAARRGHCRNRILALILAVPLAVLPILATYYWDYRHLMGAIAETEKMQSPPSAGVSDFIRDFPDYVQAKEEIGWNVTRGSSSSGQAFKGKKIFLVWGIESLIILGIVFAFVATVTLTPYCEDCNRWCDAEKSQELYGLSAASVTPAIMKGDLQGIRNLPPSGNEKNHVLRLTCNYCAHCNTSAFLSVKDVWTYGTDKKGNPKTKTTELLHNAILSPDQRAQFLARLDPKPASTPVQNPPLAQEQSA